MIRLSSKSDSNGQGFTFLEILLVLILTSILAVVLMQVVSGHTSRSFRPLQAFERRLALQEAMETICADYRKLLMTDATPLDKLEKNIEDGLYWPSGASIQLKTCKCIDFVEISSDNWNETDTHEDCTPDDKILKVTISVNNQSLTTLFSR